MAATTAIFYSKLLVIMRDRLIVIDCETGGLDCEAHSITEVALRTYDAATLKEISKYQTYIKPYDDLEITPIAIEKTQVNMKDVLAGVDIKTAVSMLMIEFKKAKNKSKSLPQIVGHNIGFDIGFLAYAFKRQGKELFDYINVVPYDTMKMMRAIEAGIKIEKGSVERFDLTSCCSRMGIKLKSAHGADNDVVATHLLFKVIMEKMRGVNIKVIENKPSEVVKSRNFYQF